MFPISSTKLFFVIALVDSSIIIGSEMIPFDPGPFEKVSFVSFLMMLTCVLMWVIWKMSIKYAELAARYHELGSSFVEAMKDVKNVLENNENASSEIIERVDDFLSNRNADVYEFIRANRDKGKDKDKA